ncbi:M23 family metallopeptidase [Streptomyces sp. NPDC006208]|uniref:murein hydrolase activator EnvC family protein n=1 Tax=Streptomyces sp. NPDC006208 TaxID=3156734 RepID=UPI0033A5A823
MNCRLSVSLGVRVLVVLLVAAVAAGAAPVGASAGARGGAGEPGPAPGGARSWPLGPPRPEVVRGWDPPASPYGRGHRGVDLASATGAPVRAAASGRVSFAGRVAGRGVLTISLTGTGDPPLRTTYEPVEPLVEEGTEVTAGQVVAAVARSSHCTTGCLHWGLRRGTEYLDPLSLLPPWMLRRAPSRLLPVFGVPVPPAAAVPADALPAPAGRAVAGTAGVLHLALLTAVAVVAHRAQRRSGCGLSLVRPAAPWRPRRRRR